MWPPENGQKLPKNGPIFEKQAQTENIFITFHYFLAKNQISWSFIAPFDQKTSKTGILTVFNTTWPPENGQKWPNFKKSGTGR